MATHVYLAMDTSASHLSGHRGGDGGGRGVDEAGALDVRTPAAGPYGRGVAPGVAPADLEVRDRAISRSKCRSEALGCEGLLRVRGKELDAPGGGMGSCY
jgi:hypothetical protein